MDLSTREKNFAKYYSYITANPEYLKLKGIPRHGSTDTYEHSIRVGYAAYRLAKRMGVDPESAARVGLLHDFCLINYQDKTKEDCKSRPWYCLHHPEEAAANGELHFGLSKEEQDAIRSHMFPLAVHVPKSRLALVLTLADKKVASIEGAAGAKYFAGKVGRHLKNNFT